MHGEKKIEIETERETETEKGSETGTEKGSAPGSESGSGTTAPPQVFSTVMKSDTDTGSMQREAMSATELVGRKKSGTENDVTERRRKQDTSPLAVIVDVVMKVKKGTVTEDTSTKSLKEEKEGGEEEGEEEKEEKEEETEDFQVKGPEYIFNKII